MLVCSGMLWCCLTRTSRLVVRNDTGLRDSFKSMPGSGFVGGMSSGKAPPSAAGREERREERREWAVRGVGIWRC